MTAGVEPFSLKDAPALIERLLPVQKLSAEACKSRWRYLERRFSYGETARRLSAKGGHHKGRAAFLVSQERLGGCSPGLRVRVITAGPSKLHTTALGQNAGRSGCDTLRCATPRASR